MIWTTVSSRSCFYWLYRVSPSLTAKNIIDLILILTIWWWSLKDATLCSSTKSVLGSKEVGDLCSKWSGLWVKVLTRWSLWFFSVEHTVLKGNKSGPLYYVDKTGHERLEEAVCHRESLFLNLLCWPSTNRRPVVSLAKAGIYSGSARNCNLGSGISPAKSQERTALLKRGKGVGRVIVNKEFIGGMQSFK